MYLTSSLMLREWVVVIMEWWPPTPIFVPRNASWSIFLSCIDFFALSFYIAASIKCALINTNFDKASYTSKIGSSMAVLKILAVINKGNDWSKYSQQIVTFLTSLLWYIDVGSKRSTSVWPSQFKLKCIPLFPLPFLWQMTNFQTKTSHYLYQNTPRVRFNVSVVFHY